MAKTDTDPEVVPETAEPAPTPEQAAEAASYLQRIREDHAVYIAAHDCMWGTLVAYPQGAAVAASHPMLDAWIAEGSAVPRQPVEPAAEGTEG